jgi:polar amino acid transport system substrate-binding protein
MLQDLAQKYRCPVNLRRHVARPPTPPEPIRAAIAGVVVDERDLPPNAGARDRLPRTDQPHYDHEPTNPDQCLVSQTAPRDVVAELAPTGVLRAGINLGNFLLVSGKSPAGEPEGVAPDIARAIADRLGVSVVYVPFARPGELADAAGRGVWDIGLIAAEPARAEAIAFSPAYALIEATYLVPAGSPIGSIEAVDRPEVRIAIASRSAYDLWLSRHLRHARLVRAASLDAAFEQFVAGRLDALAGLRPRLLQDLERLPGARILDGQFTAVQQAIGTARANQAGARFLHDFVEDAKASGLVARLIERHHVHGLSIAPPG